MNQKSIAVLPFHNISSDTENEYFADGITEELINALSNIDALKVTARTSSFIYKGKSVDIRVIGNELGVSTVLEGSVRKAGNRVRITAQLIRTDSGFHIWSESFDRELSDIFQLQDEISVLIADKIRENYGHFHINEHLVVPKTSNMEAYQQFLKGRFYQLNWSANDFSRAIDFYKLSIKLDAAFYQPYFGIVQCYGILGAWSFMDRQEAFDLADEYLKKGLAIQPESSEAYFSLATHAFWVNWNPHQGLAYLEKGLAITPNDTELLESAAECYTALGQFDDAMNAVNKALEINPLSINHHYTKGNIYYLRKQYTEALHWMSKALEMDPNWDLAIRIKACCFILQEDKASLEEWLTNMQNVPNAHNLLLLYEAKNENKIPSLQDFTEVQSQYLPWEVYVPLYTGDKAAALTALKLGLDQHIGQYVNFMNDPFLEPLKNELLYQQFCQDTFPAAAQSVTPSVLSTKPSTPKLTEGEISTFKDALIRVMEEEELYLNSELTLRMTAEAIQLHPNKLSWLLNEVVGKSFNEFINSYRLASFQAKAGLPAYTNLTILGLAYECGFNSKSVFNEFFKKQIGTTPSKWIRQHVKR